MFNTAFLLSVVVPVYNEAENMGPLLEELQAALAPLEGFEIIMVDDGSTDATVTTLEAAKAGMERLRVLQHKGNYGQSAAVLSGVRAASYDWVAVLDGDGQNPPKDIITLLSALDDYVGEPTHAQKPVLLIGHRQGRKDNWLRLLSSRVANGVRRGVLNDDCPDSGCGLKLFRRADFMRLPYFNHAHRFMPALFKSLGGDVVSVPVGHRPRCRGQSKYGVMNRLWVGILDLFGVGWLTRRACHPEVDPEITLETTHEL